ATRNRPARAAAPAPTPAGRWTVQVGAFREEAVARDWLNNVSRRFSSQFSNAQRDVQTANGWYRSRFTGMTQQAAEAACEALSERRVTCMVVRPS
ncbi:MAG TPA: serine hydrolase, partial [Brevundimonas sp.]|nr:serine hydrolase [Brevundimonas sp.]